MHQYNMLNLVVANVILSLLVIMLIFVPGPAVFNKCHFKRIQFIAYNVSIHCSHSVTG